MKKFDQQLHIAVEDPSSSTSILQGEERPGSCSLLDYPKQVISVMRQEKVPAEKTWC